ncbi:electron transfer flavoprotein subunit alpha/FixB family protein [Bacillus sp. B15-48]|uniref:electron transfer flavoprotein subunit alpha/FixB family protein n=1 Tax=Bacillus sp. B15-48 TaxID=1548601 RepID=UPI001940064D|nr:electron transfer flavoprotein subunit alpha/FixB family protein [Bacillus sp. B15-48]MBM4761275.1 electron transfer flavoprotein subunit alpha [Bacillus sp. B15-48]
MSQDASNIWVLVEKTNDKVINPSLELLKRGKELAEAKAEKVVAVVFRSTTDEALKTVAAYGADEIIVVDGDQYQHFNLDSYSYAVTTLVAKYNPSALLTAATKKGRDLISRVAAKLQVGSAADSVAVDVGEDGVLTWTREIYGGHLLSTVSFPGTKPQMGSVRPGAYDKGEPDLTKSAEVVREEVQTPSDEIRSQVIELLASVEEGIKLEEADVVIAGGRGLGKAENVELLNELAAVLGGAVGGTRACIDAGWMTANQQIGQSGKKVAPKLYIGCGISGAIQHVGGISAADVIVAINKDPDAPIFEIADYAIVGDLFEVVPVLVEEIKNRQLVLA